VGENILLNCEKVENLTRTQKTASNIL